MPDTYEGDKTAQSSSAGWGGGGDIIKQSAGNKEEGRGKDGSLNGSRSVGKRQMKVLGSSGSSSRWRPVSQQHVAVDWNVNE